MEEKYKRLIELHHKHGRAFWEIIIKKKISANQVDQKVLLGILKSRDSRARE